MFSQTLPDKERDISIHPACTITPDDLMRHLEILTSDSLQGRETAFPGQKKAAAYIRDHFNDLDLSPVSISGEETFYQTFSIENLKVPQVTLVAGDQMFLNGTDFIFSGNMGDQAEDTLDVVFAGYGTPSDLKKIDKRKHGVLIIHSKNGPGNLSDKIDLCRREGYKSIFIIYGERDQVFTQLMGISRRYQRGAWVRENLGDISLFFVPPALGSGILKKDMEQLLKASRKSQAGKRRPFRKIGDASLIIHTEMHDSLVSTENVLAYLEGSEKPDECVIVSAHYDHVGIRDGILYPGADDNASGTASLMEIAEAFSLGPVPKRSLLFIAFTGEEKGLLGSDYYVNHPVFSISGTIADLNIDMIGRIDKRHSTDTGYVYIIGSDKLSHDLHELSEEVNRTYTGLLFDYTYNDNADPNRFYYRSDQYSFAKNNIPVIFYFTGLHEDYHKPTDTMDKINFEHMTKVARLIFHTAWEIANREERIDIK